MSVFMTPAEKKTKWDEVARLVDEGVAQKNDRVMARAALAAMKLIHANAHHGVGVDGIRALARMNPWLREKGILPTGRPNVETILEKLLTEEEPAG